MKKRFYLVGIFTIFIFSCFISNAFPWRKKTDSINNLRETSWQLVTLKEKNVGSITVDDDAKISLSFTKNGVSGFSGVNRFSGRYEVNNDSISFSELSVNLMSGSRSAMNFEERFLRILRSAKKVRRGAPVCFFASGAGRCAGRAAGRILLVAPGARRGARHALACGHEDLRGPIRRARAQGLRPSGRLRHR